MKNDEQRFFMFIWIAKYTRSVEKFFFILYLSSFKPIAKPYESKSIIKNLDDHNDSDVFIINFCPNR